MSIKVLFLDFDGVIFTPGGCIHSRMQSGGERHPKWELDPVSLSLIEYLLQKHEDMKVVVSSVWRFGNSIEELQKILGPKIGPRVIGKTPDLGGYRGKEIAHYIANDIIPNYTLTDIIILDDDSDMNPLMGYLFKTNSYNGFTFLDYSKIEEYLKMTPRQKKIRQLKESAYRNLRGFYYGTKFKIYLKLLRLFEKITGRR